MSPDADDVGSGAVPHRKASKPSILRKLNDWLYYPWIGVVLAAFAVQASRNSEMSAAVHDRLG